MAGVKVTRKFQVTIPKELRRRIGLEIGEELLVKEDRGRIVMEKAVDVEKLAGAWSHIEETEEFMAEARELWRRWKI